MESVSIKLSDNWTVNRMAELLRILDETYNSFLVMSAIEDALTRKEETVDVNESLIINGQISTLEDILLRAPEDNEPVSKKVDKSRELIPYNKLQIEKIRQEDGKPGGILKLIGYDKPIQGVRWALSSLKRLALIKEAEKFEAEKIKAAKLENVERLYKILTENMENPKTRQRILIRILDDAELLSDLFKDDLIAFEDDDPNERETE